MSKGRLPFLKGRAATAILSSVVTLVVGLAAINLLPGEKPLERPVSSSYAVQDEAFARSMGTSVGSTNFDNRSFKLNDEANLNVLDVDLALRERATFERDKARSRRVTLQEWAARPRWERFKGWIADRFRSQL